MLYHNNTNALSQDENSLSQQSKRYSLITTKQTLKLYHNKANAKALSQQGKRFITTRQILYHNKTNALSQQVKC